MTVLAHEILADDPLRFYRMGEHHGPVYDMVQGIPLFPNNAPQYRQTGGIPSAPTELAVFNSNSSSHFGLGTGVASDAGGGGGAAKPWAMMVVVKVHATVGINEWLFSEGSSLGTNPLLGFSIIDAAGRPNLQMRTADNTTNSLNAPVATDIRGAWTVLHGENDPTDATTGMRLYINGTLVASRVPAGGYGATATVFDRMAIASLFRNSATPSNSSPGHFQYAAIFDHALGQTRITAHMDAFNASPPAAGTVIVPDAPPAMPGIVVPGFAWVEEAAPPGGGPALNEDIVQQVDAPFRVRFEVQNTGLSQADLGYELQFSQNGGTWTTITTSTPLKASASPNFADDDPTTNLLPSGTGTFSAGVGKEDEAATPNIVVDGGDHTEIEWALVIDSAAAGDTFDLRLKRTDGETMTYTEIPRVTAVVTLTMTGGGSSAFSSGGALVTQMTLSRTGGATLISSAGGPRWLVMAQTGGATSQFATGGTSAQAVQKTGGALAQLVAGGQKAMVNTRTGGAVANAVAGGQSKLAEVFTGGAAMNTKTGGALASVMVRAGGAIMGLLVGGGREVSAGTQYTGGAKTGMVAGGPYGAVFAKTGGSSTNTVAGGARFSVNARTGGATMGGVAGGPRDIKTALMRTGGAIANFLLGGARKEVQLRTGGAILNALVGGALDSGAVITRTGGALTALLLGGTRKEAQQRTGGALAQLLLGGARQTATVKTGGAVRGSVAGGPRNLARVATGGAVMRADTGGPRFVGQIVNRTGGMRSAAVSGGTLNWATRRTGGSSASARTGGPRNIVVLKAGGGSSVFSTASPRNVAQNKTGGAMMVPMTGATGLAARSEERGGGAIAVLVVGGTGVASSYARTYHPLAGAKARTTVRGALGPWPHGADSDGTMKGAEGPLRRGARALDPDRSGTTP